MNLYSQMKEVIMDMKTTQPKPFVSAGGARLEIKAEPTTEAFFKECAKHDWYFNWSDDYAVYKEGLAYKNRLQQAAKEYPRLKPILEAWSNYMFSGPGFGTEKHPQPKLEDF